MVRGSSVYGGRHQVSAVAPPLPRNPSPTGSTDIPDTVRDARAATAANVPDPVSGDPAPENASGTAADRQGPSARLPGAGPSPVISAS